MKTEGTGDPLNPEISFDASVRMRELRFEKVPSPDVGFRGSTRRDSIWVSRRENLPDEVREGVAYGDSGIRLRIASGVAGDIAHDGPHPRTTGDIGRVKTGGKVRE